MRPDATVVPHLNLIVDLHPFFDHSIIDGAPVNGTGGADTHICADLDAA
jgi:hypothetical protein